MRSTYAGLVIAAFLTACESGPVTGPESLAPDAPSLDSYGAVLHTVSGGGTLNYVDGDEPYAVEHYGFNVRLYANGMASGQFQATWDWPENLDRIHAEIVCAEVDGNQAGIVISITKSTSIGMYQPFPEGYLLGFAVRDNGEGSAEPQDEISYFYGPIMYPELACHALATDDYPEIEWTHGNVQIR